MKRLEEVILMRKHDSTIPTQTQLAESTGVPTEEIIKSLWDVCGLAWECGER